MFIMYTLDSHDYFGPFVSEAGLHRYGRETNKTSYRVIKLLDSGKTLEYDPN
jgi:hypothetical protein